tara:strand:+ start:7916 stop:9163 length:1248 start_codon:yes stop_codon:yes gene_type:complete
MKNKRVVVTGMGAITPIGNNISEYWEGLVNGVSGAKSINRFNIDNFKTKFACQIKNYLADDFFEKKESRKLDLFSQYGLIAAEEAINDSLIDLTKCDKNRFGVIWGSGIGGMETFQNQILDFSNENQIPRFNPFFIPKLIPDICPGLISIKYNLKGPNFATVSACASSSNAIIDAYNYIKLGYGNIFISGGSEAPINKSALGGFNALKALSVRNDSPKTASRPFDRDRDGFVLGEGSGALIIEELEHALKRDAKIYAEIIGIGMSSDAYHITAPHPEGKGAELVMKNVLKDANISSKDIDYINVHGTSTPLGDIAEVKAIENVFDENTKNINISSTKSMTGHLLGAAGAIEAIASILAINNDRIPPTINYFNNDEKINKKLNFTFNKSQKREVKITINNTFGFGGHNTSIAFKKY